jgi:Fe-S-cluster containining protein
METESLRICRRCGRCCRKHPGWFAPGEPEKAAMLLGLPMADFVKKYLIIDYIETNWGKIEVFVPVKVDKDGVPVEPTNSKASRVYPMKKGTCIFYDEAEKGCRIYFARPIECRRYHCENSPEENMSKLQIAEMWYRSWEEAQKKAKAREKEEAKEEKDTR